MCGIVNAGVYYTSPSGTGDGSTPATPRAWNNATWVKAGDTIYLLDGEYGFWTTTVEGKSGSEITFKAVNKHEPMFTRVAIQSSYLNVSGIDVNTPNGDYAVYIAGLPDKRLTNITMTNSKVHGNALGTGPCRWLIWGRDIDNSLIEDCNVYDGGVQGANGARGIDLWGCKNVTVRRCHVYNFIGSGIRTGGGTNILFEYNVVHTQRCDLAPGIHGSGAAIHSHLTTLRGNIIYDCGNSRSLYFYFDVAGDYGYHDILVENNLIFKTSNPPATYNWVEFQDMGTNCVIRNNTFVDGCKIFFAKNADGSGLSLHNNIFVGGLTLNNYGTSDVLRGQTPEVALAKWPAVSEGGNIYTSLNATGNGYQIPRTQFSGTSTSTVNSNADYWAVGAMFETKTGDYPYQLAEGSPAIDAADQSYAPPLDLLANPRDTAPDAGCYERTGFLDNRSPVLDIIGNQGATVGIDLVLNIAAIDPDGGTLTFSAAGLPTGATFSNQTFTWTPASDQIGIHQVTFTVTDGSAEDSETITITVERQNAAPVLAGIGGKSVNENQTITFTISATDADGDAIAYSASGLPTGATFTGQTFSWTPGYDQAGSHNVTFVAGDGRTEDSETIALSVANVNRAPALVEIGDRSVDENGTLSFALAAADPDGTALTYSATGLPTGANLAGGSFTWTPTDEQIGSHEITFVASDGEASDSETVTIAVVSTMTDQTAPVVGRPSPAAGDIQVPLNNLITLHVTDAGRGVDAASVRITVDDEVVYEGDTTAYTSTSGRCSRLGAKNDYEFVYQRDRMFDFDHTVTVTVNAADRMGNVMSGTAYSFTTEMRTFGSNKRVSGADAASAGAAATVADDEGNIWAAWHAGSEDARDIYVTRLRAGQEAFDEPVQVTTDPGDQCNPDIARTGDGVLYVVWQDNRRGNWDIYLSTTSDGETFTREALVTDSNDNQIEPVVTIDGASPSRAYVAWQDDRNGNQDLFVASSTNAFASMTTAAVTTNAADQTSPDMAVDATNTAYLVWTDSRSGQADIYAAASTASWTNVPLVTGAGSQTSPAIAATPGGALLHLLWVSDATGDTDIYYASSNGLPSNPLTGTNIIDDTTDATQGNPALACAADGKVFACWKDERNIGTYGEDTDVYFAEIGSNAGGTNILVDDEGNGANQDRPTLCVMADNQPCVAWTDDRNIATEIYCAATTCIDPTPLYSTLVTAAAGATIGVNPAAINGAEDVSVVVPAGACPTDLQVTISRITNPLIASTDCLGSYDFGPSGIEFDQPVTVTIPYEISETNDQAQAYWYNSLTGALSQQGITDIEHLTINGNVYALRFRTTHFTPYYVVTGDARILAYSSSDGSGGGGCSISRSADNSPRHLLVPYIIVVVAMAVLRHKDRKRAMRSIES